MDMIFIRTTRLSQRAEPSPLWSKASPKRRITHVAVASRAIKASVMGEGEGSGGGNGGPRESPPGRGFEGAGAPRQHQCITLGRLAPPALSAVRAQAPPPPRTARRARGVQVEGRLAETELRPRPRALRSSGSLSGPAIPVSPQAARPAVSERGIGAGGVSGCSGMPGSEKVQPARQSWRIQGGQDTVERHDALSVVMEKIDQWEQENPASNGREMIDDFRLRGSRPCRHMGDHLTKGGWRK